MRGPLAGELSPVLECPSKGPHLAPGSSAVRVQLPPLSCWKELRPHRPRQRRSHAGIQATPVPPFHRRPKPPSASHYGGIKDKVVTLRIGYYHVRETCLLPLVSTWFLPSLVAAPKSLSPRMAWHSLFSPCPVLLSQQSPGHQDFALQAPLTFLSTRG